MPTNHIADAGINKLVSLALFLLTDRQQDYFQPYVGGHPAAPWAFHRPREGSGWPGEATTR